MALHLFFGEIILRTKENHRLPGYAGKYLGKRAQVLVAFSTIIGGIGALLAYLILAGRLASLLWPLPADISSFFIWAVLSLFVLAGIKSISKVELLLNLGLFLVMALIFGFSLSKINLANFSLFNQESLFLPFGVILFSLIGISAIPEIAELLKKKEQMKKVIILASLITVCFTFLFGLIVSGVTGPATSQEPFQSLLPFLGQKIVILGALFGILAISTSFLVVGNHLKNFLRFDYKVPPVLAFSIACFAPMLLFLAGIRQFIAVIGLVGLLTGLIEGIAIVLIYRKAKTKGERRPAYNLQTPPFLFYLIIIALALGALAQVIYG